MLEEFNKYVSNYDLDDTKIKLKYKHSIKVMELSKRFATKLGFSEDDIKLATLIGLLHDFGRFEQVKVYNTFIDRLSIDHADYSVIQLFDKGLIKNFWDREEDYSLIRFAIKNHNKYKVEDCNNERFILFANFIRDMDKLDILRVLLEEYNYDLDNSFKDIDIDIDIRNSFFNKKIVNSSNNTRKRNDFEKIVFNLCYVYDINNKECFPLLKELYSKVRDKYNHKVLDEYYDYLFNYLERGV